MKPEHKLNPKQLAAVILEAANTIKSTGGSYIRIGQAFYNALHKLYPDVASSIHGTDCDPFHNDRILEKTIEKIT